MLNILDQLAKTSSRNDKIKILEANKDNQTLKYFFWLALDPMVTFGIKKIPQPSYSEEVCGDLFFNLSRLEPLRSRTLTGNAAIEHLAKILGESDLNDREVIQRVIEKDPKCGVADSSVNKVWPGLVFEFPIMKASPYDDKSIQSITFPAYSQTKLDGARCALVVRQGTVVALSSSGREIATMNQFDYVKNLNDGEFVLDGELLVVEETGKFMERKKGNGIVNKAVKGTISEKEAKSLHFVVFDMITMKDWLAGFCGKSYSKRFASLVSLSDNFRHNISIVETKIVETEGKAVSHFKDMLAIGEEGTILKSMESPWENKRSKYQVKMKGIISCDLVVKSVEEGTGKNKGKLGALVCESSDGLVEVNVGTGFSDKERDLPMKSWVGKVVEVSYNERIINKTEGSKWSLFLPRFVRVRLDKDVPDNIDNIPLKA